MTWNWGNAKRKKLSRRKPSLEGGDENTAAVVKLAESYIRRGYTRQRAYAQARKELHQSFRSKRKKALRGGAVSPK